MANLRLFTESLPVPSDWPSLSDSDLFQGRIHEGPSCSFFFHAGMGPRQKKYT